MQVSSPAMPSAAMEDGSTSSDAPGSATPLTPSLLSHQQQEYESPQQRADDASRRLSHVSLMADTQQQQMITVETTLRRGSLARDSHQMEIARLAAKGKCRRRALTCLGLLLFFVCSVALMFGLSILVTYSDGDLGVGDGAGGGDEDGRR